MRWNGAPQVVDRLAWALTNTWTYHLFGTEHLQEACRRSPTGTAMLVLWHCNLLMLAGGIRGQGMRIAALVSRSGDGALIAVHLNKRGVRTVRGSSHRGAATAAKELFAVAKEGYHPAIAIDGPKGPAFRTRSGPIEIAARTGLPIVPMAARATSEWHLPTWDRLRVPPPRAHVAIGFAPALWPATGSSGDAQVAGLATTLHDLGAAMAQRCGRRDGVPAPRHVAWLNQSSPANTPH